MKKFRFPLRSVATVRSIAELRARENFSKAVQIYVEAENQLRALRTRLTEFEEILRSGRGRAFRAADQASFLAAFKEDTIRATKMEADVARVRQELEVARQAWLESRRDVRVVEKLEHKARLLHRQQSEHEDQLAMDDRTNGLIARNAAKAS